MKLLHTSDWHLGRNFHEKRRDHEFGHFFDWLIKLIEDKQIDVLLICGDIFDNSNPSSKAQEFYFNFLGRVAKTKCQNVVVIAGNHDSPTLIDAPKKLLQSLNIFTVGSVSNNISEQGKKIEDEVLILKDTQNNPVLIVCAVPFLRDSYIRIAETGEGIDQKTQKLLRGIQDHYQKVHEVAQQKRSQLDNNIPIVVMGHLYARGGKTIDGDGVRPLYIGNLAEVDASTFSSNIDYVALGHLHSPQMINNCKTIRYSGSPLPMVFAEAKQQKCAILVDILNGKVNDVEEIAIPSFQHLVSIDGNMSEIRLKIADLQKEKAPVWVEIILNDNTPNFQDILNTLTDGSNVEVLKFTNTHVRNQVLQQRRMDESLDDLTDIDVFMRCLEIKDYTEEERAELLTSYNEILLELQQLDELGEGS